MCKELSVAPRSGGLFEQPAHEVMLLDTVYDAINRHYKRLEEKDKKLGRNLQRSAAKEIG